MLIFCTSLMVWGCGASEDRVSHPEGGSEAGEESGGETMEAGGEKPVHLSTVQVKSIEPPDDEEYAGLVEEVIAFNHIGSFVECETNLPPGTLPEGSIVIQLSIDTLGNLFEDPAVVLTTSSEKGDLEACLESAIAGIDYSEVNPPGDYTFHVILKYSR
jgi:hypothetical protein